MATGTNNPPGSDDPLDLRANAKNLDLLLLGPNSSYPSRLGVEKRSWEGINSAYDSAEANRDALFQAKLENTGYELPSFPYAAGISIVRETQLIERLGEYYRAKAGVVPFVTTGVWATDELSLVAVGDAALRQELAAPTGSTIVSTILSSQGALKRTVGEKIGDWKSIKDWGAIGDRTVHPVSEWYTIGFSAYRGYANLAAVQVDYPHVSSSTDSIDWAAIQASQNYAASNPCYIDLLDLKLVVNKTIIWKGGAYLEGVQGVAEISLAPASNCSLIESNDFDYWSAWTSGSKDGYTLNGGINGITLNGNAGAQTVEPTGAADMQYALRIHSHRFSIGWLQVRNVNGIGVLTQYNQALMNSYRFDGLDGDYGLFGDPRGTPSPFQFGNINVIDTLYESFVFMGPSDIPIWHLTTNYCGWLDNATIPTTPRTSLLFPGEPIDSVRIEAVCKLGYVNANGALFGRSISWAENVRMDADKIIESSSWGGVYFGPSAYGCINSMTIQQNAFSYGGVYKPMLDCATGAGSSANKGRVTVSHLAVRRISGGDVDNIGPAIYDDAGHHFMDVQGIDSFDTPGHGIIAGPNSVAGLYCFRFDSLTGTASDGTPSAAFIAESGARDWRVVNSRITDCARGIVNKGTNMRGTVTNTTIEVNNSGATGQVAMEGVVSSSQLASVTAGSGNIAVENLRDWTVEILDNGVRYYDKFKGVTTFNTGAVANLTSAAISHKMWRTPSFIDCQATPAWGGATPPAVTVGIKGAPTPTDVTLFCNVTGASAGTLTAIVAIN